MPKLPFNEPAFPPIYTGDIEKYLGELGIYHKRLYEEMLEIIDLISGVGGERSGSLDEDNLADNVQFTDS